MLDDVITGALGNVLASIVAGTARHLGVVQRTFGERRRSADLELATWFNTYKLTEDVPLKLRQRLNSAVLRVNTDVLKQRLASDRCHAVLHELLAARLTDAPEHQLTRLRTSFAAALRPEPSAGASAAADDITDVVFEYFDDQICELVARLDGALPDAARRLRERAIGHRIVAILDAIERHEAARAGEYSAEADRVFLERYRRHVVKEFGKLTPPDLEQRRRVPIEDLYVPPCIAPIPMGPDAAEKGSTPASQALLTEFTQNIERTVLLGDPGAGKTTAARALMHAHANSSGGRTPFLVTVREYAKAQQSVVDHLDQVIESSYQCAPLPGWVQRQLLDGAALVIFDGLDELIDTSRRADISSIIEHFCTEYPLARVLVTSRFVGYEQAPLDEEQFVRYRIDRFDDDQVAEYALKWFTSDGTLAPDQAEKDAESFVAESASVPDLRSNPLLLSLMCVLYRGEGYIPQHRAEVYRRCADLLFHTWDASRHIHVALSITQAQITRTLRSLAYWLLTREDTSTAVTEHALIRKTAELLARDIQGAEEAQAAAAEFVRFCHGRGWIFADVGTTADGEPMYTFAHRTFLEYFAAEHLAVTADTPEDLARTLLPKVTRGEWDVVAQLAIAVKDRTSERGAERILTALFADRRYTSLKAREKLLILAADCFDSVSLPVEQADALIDRALDFVLANSGEPYAGEMVLNAWHFKVVRKREAVAARFLARAQKLIATDDVKTRSVGYYLALDDADSAVSFWKSWSRANFERFAAALAADVSQDETVLQLAVKHELVRLREILTQPDGMRALYRDFHDPLAGRFRSSALSLAGVHVRVYADPLDRDWRICQDFGAYLLERNPPLPMVDRDNWFGNITDAALDTEHHITEPVYLAVAVLTAADVEAQLAAYPSPFEQSPVSGWLHAFAPYIKTRAGTPEPLGPLPVREDYQRLFERWARGEVDFTYPAPEDDNTATA